MPFILTAPPGSASMPARPARVKTPTPIPLEHLINILHAFGVLDRYHRDDLTRVGLKLRQMIDTGLVEKIGEDEYVFNRGMGQMYVE